VEREDKDARRQAANDNAAGRFRGRRRGGARFGDRQQRGVGGQQRERVDLLGCATLTDVEVGDGEIGDWFTVFVEHRNIDLHDVGAAAELRLRRRGRLSPKYAEAGSERQRRRQRSAPATWQRSQRRARICHGRGFQDTRVWLRRRTTP